MSGVCVCAYSYYSPEKEQATRPYTRLDLLHLGPLFPHRTKDAKGEERRGWWGKLPALQGTSPPSTPHEVICLQQLSCSPGNSQLRH